MNKGERTTRDLISRYPDIRIEAKGKTGYVAVASNGRRFTLGSFGSKSRQDGHHATNNLEAWCKRNSR